MYFKIALLLVNVVFAAAQNCNCSGATIEQSLKESNDIVEFLVKVSKTAVSEDEKYPAVPPGVVTGSLGCQCSENLRRKRKILPREDIPLIDKPRVTEQEIATPVPSKRISNRNCPVGYLRVGKTCINANEMLY